MRRVMPNLGGPELVILLVIIFVVFGAGKLPDVFRSLGKGVKEFRAAQNESDNAASKDDQRTTKT